MLRTGNICLSFLINYLKSNTGSKEKISSKNEKLKCLSDTFSNYGGILTKISQVLKYQYDSDSDVFSNCKPFNPKKTLLRFKEEIYNNPDRYSSVENIDYNIYKSGSIGQVHRAQLSNGQQIIFKVQYDGIGKQFETDFNVLDNIVKYLFYNQDLTDAVNEIKSKLIDELDYNLEIKNQLQQYSIWKDDSVIKIPIILPNLCSEKILCMEFIHGLTLNDFIKTASQEDINKIGMELVRFTFTNIYDYGLFYSDIHYGNFIIDNSDKNNLKLCVTDFGCINTIDNDVKQNLILMHKFLISNTSTNKDEFYNLLIDMKLIKEDEDNNEILDNSKELLFEFFKLQFLPWTSKYFKFDTDSDWWKKTSSFTDLSVIKKLKLPANIVYLGKIPFGLFYIFGQMKMEGSFSSLFEELFHEHLY
jgi:ubiquinone biosynthesis protein